MNLRLATMIVVAAVGGCTAAGAPPNLSADCSAQAAILDQGVSIVPKLLTAERAAIDAQIAQSKGYCTGTLPADQTAASKAVEASSAQISATLAIASLRK